MELCERCGVELPDGAAFCRQCGRRTTPSWAVARPPGSPPSPAGGSDPDTDPRAPAPGDAPANVLSTLAVFFGVVATVNVLVGAVALVLASAARVRNEPSSRFAIVVAACGAVLGVVVRTVVLDGS
jgi:hypothetical protein